MRQVRLELKTLQEQDIKEYVKIAIQEARKNKQIRVGDSSMGRAI